jgi:low temperature requirement protein LtrA
MADLTSRPRRPWTMAARPADDKHRVTNFELLFDLVYVFAVTQVTGYMTHEHSARAVLQGLLILALLWWTWSAYTWLGNQASAEDGLLRPAIAVAMAAMFVVALTVPRAWHAPHGGLTGPLVLVCAYLLVRCVHLAVYAVAAAGDKALRRQVAVTFAPLLAGAAFLVAGALLGGWTQTLMFAAALLTDWGGVYLTSRHGSWRIRSPAHWTERHGGFVILAIGESVVAVGVGASGQAITAPLVIAAILGVAAALGLWWLYFDVVSLAAERRFLQARGPARVKLAIDGYTYGHFPIVAGIVIAAVGVRGVLGHADHARPLGYFYAAALFGGFAVYLAGHVLFKRRMHEGLSLPRIITAGVLLAVLPAAAWLPPLAGLAGLVGILASLIAVETTRYASLRHSLRHEPAPG